MERRELRDYRPFGYIDKDPFRRLGLGFVLVLPAIYFGALTVDGILDLVAGRHLEHLVPRILVFIVAVFCATFAIGLIGRTVREGRFDAYAPEWAIGDVGDVCHADGWDGSLWMSMSERELPPPAT
jgi:hypothetical protein